MNNIAVFPEPSTIGPKRRRLGVTQQALAKDAGISQSMLAKVESGSVQPGYAAARRIFEALEARELKDGKVVEEVMHGPVISLESNDTVKKAVELAKDNKISQFPVISDGKIVGSIRTSQLVGLKPGEKIGWQMSEPFPAVGRKTQVASVIALVKAQQAVVVMDKDKIVGIVTAEDLL